MVEQLDEFRELYEMGLITAAEFDLAVEGFEYMRTRRSAPWVRRRTYGLFNLNTMRDEDIELLFRFKRAQIPLLQRGFQIPDEVYVEEGRYRIPGSTALCILLRRLAYPNRLSDLEGLFGLSGRTLSAVAREMVQHIMETKGHILEDLGTLTWLNTQRLASYATAIGQKSGALRNCWGFIDGTARRNCRPTVDQEAYYSGHKRYHCLKYQAIVTPDGMVVSLDGSYPGRRHDAGIWRESDISNQLRSLCVTENGTYVLYGDPAYPISDLLISPFPANSTEPNAAEFNAAMSKVRQAVEWGFGKIVRDFAFVDFHKNQKILLQNVSSMYKVAALLSNCHTILNGSQIGHYFGLNPPLLEEYLN